MSLGRFLRDEEESAEEEAGREPVEPPAAAAAAAPASKEERPEADMEDFVFLNVKPPHPTCQVI